MKEEEKQEIEISEVQNPRNCWQSVRKFFVNLAVCCMPVAQRSVDIFEDITSKFLAEKINSNQTLTQEQKNLLLQANAKTLRSIEQNLVNRIGEWAEGHREDFEKNKLMLNAAKIVEHHKIFDHAISAGHSEIGGDLKIYKHNRDGEILDDHLPPVLIHTTKKLETLIKEMMMRDHRDFVGIEDLKKLSHFAMIPKEKFAEMVTEVVDQCEISSKLKAKLLSSEAVKALCYMILEEHNKKISETSGTLMNYYDEEEKISEETIIGSSSYESKEDDIELDVMG